MGNKVGRPKTPKYRARAPGISVRLTPEEAKVIGDAVAKCGIKNKSDWARKCLLYVVSNGICIT